MPIDFSFHMEPWLIVALAVPGAVFLVFVIIWSIRAHQHQVSAGREDLIGRTALVDVTLNPGGVVFVEGELWTALSEEGKIEAAEEVVINRVEGLKLYVTRKKKEVSK